MRGLINVSKFELVNYFDVWGNKKDGYEVNNQCREGIVELSDNATNKDIIHTLIDFGFFNETASTKNVEIQDFGDMIELFDKKSQKPLCHLMIVNE